MTFVLSKADLDALNQVNITIAPDNIDDKDFKDTSLIGRGEDGFVLNSDNLQFPPLMTKDTKSSVWEEKSHSGAFEPFKVYKMSNSRDITLELQYVTGGKYTGKVIHDIISNIRAYFYYANVGAVNSSGKYPAVTIQNFYGIVDDAKTTWRMMNVDVKRSKEMVRSPDSDGSKFFALHTVITMNLESATQIAREQGGESKIKDAALAIRPLASWF